MKLTNTTHTPEIPDYTLRRMTAFCCRVLEIKTSTIKELVIRNKSDGGTSGRCWLSQGRIVCSVGFVLGDKPREGSKRDPDSSDIYRQADERALRTRVMRLLSVLAHEVAHRATYLQGTAKGPRNGRPGNCERQTQWHANLVVAEFNRHRELIDDWIKPPAKPERAPAKDPAKARAQADLKLLKTWERKKALAATKVAKYNRKVRRAIDKGLL